MTLDLEKIELSNALEALQETLTASVNYYLRAYTEYGNDYKKTAVNSSLCLRSLFDCQNAFAFICNELHMKIKDENMRDIFEDKKYYYLSEYADIAEKIMELPILMVLYPRASRIEKGIQQSTIMNSPPEAFKGMATKLFVIVEQALSYRMYAS